MTESDFTVVTSLARVRAMQGLLHGLYADESGPITPKTRRTVAIQLDRWEEKLNRLVEKSREETERREEAEKSPPRPPDPPLTGRGAPQGRGAFLSRPDE